MKKYETTMMDTTKMATTMMKDTTLRRLLLYQLNQLKLTKCTDSLTPTQTTVTSVRWELHEHSRLDLPLLKDASNVVTKILTASTQPLNCPNIASVVKLFLLITLQDGTLTKPTCAVVNSLTQKL